MPVSAIPVAAGAVLGRASMQAAPVNQAVHVTLWSTGCCGVAPATPARNACRLSYRPAP
jgi:hypothetical protein